MTTHEESGILGAESDLLSGASDVSGAATPAAASKLAQLLETLPAADRAEITAWLLGRTQPTTGWLPAGSATGATAGRVAALRRELAKARPAGEDSQLVTIRFPTEQHERLRTWCAEHGFTMAAVVRGLVDRFLDSQTRPTA
jgi:hypothetical protein